MNQAQNPQATQISVRVLRGMLLYFKEKRGAGEFAALLEAGGLDQDDLKGSARFMAPPLFEKVIALARQMLGGDEEFFQASVYKIGEGYGPFLFLAQALSPKAILGLASRKISLVHTGARARLEKGRRGAAIMRFSCAPPLSRLHCRLRIAQARALLAFFGHPVSKIVEISCMAEGAPECVHEFEWPLSLSHLPLAAGGLLGVFAAWLLPPVPLTDRPLLVLLGLCAGLIYETFRYRRAASKAMSLYRRNLDALAGQESEAQRRRIHDEGMFKILIETAIEGVWMSDQQSLTTFVNPRLCAMLGYAPEELLGRSFLDLIDRGSRREAEESMEKKGVYETTHTREVSILRKDGSWLPTLLSAKPLFGPDGSAGGAVATVMDNSALKQVQAQLLHAQKMESVGRLAGGVAHDFNNVLTAIFGHSEFLLETLSEPSQVAEVKSILNSAQRAAAVTRQLLAFSRQKAFDLRPVDLNTLLAEMSLMLGRLLGEDIALDLRALPLPAFVLSDAAQIQQALVNLAINARDAMPQGGSLMLHLEQVESGPMEAGLGRVAGNYVMLQVRDTGSGMPQEVLDHLFEPFFTTKEQGKGTGLGLAMVYGFMNQNGGSIEVESAPGKGTCFSLYFPATPAPSPSGSGRPSASTARARAGETLLLVEDDAQVRNVLSASLRRLGYQVLECSGPLQALELCERLSRPVDLVISDVIMPDMTGPDMVQQLQVMGNPVPALFVSGYTGEALANSGMKLDSSDLLRKPFVTETLAEKVRAKINASQKVKKHIPAEN